jgi:hypothetical protein
MPQNAKSRHFLSIFVVLFLFIYEALGVTLSGNVSTKRMNITGDIWESYDTPFRVSLDGDRWLMSTSYKNEHIDVTGFDGTNMYDVLLYKKTTDAIDDDIELAYISGSCYPFDSEPATCFVWLALESGSFLSSSLNDLPGIWTHPFMDPASHAQRISKLDFIPGSPGFPSDVEFVFSSRFLLGKSTNTAFLSSTISQDAIKKIVNDNEIVKLENTPRAKYKVISTTNFEGKVFPLVFQLDVFGPREGSVMETFVGRVKTLDNETPATFIPKLDTTTSVRDFRFSDRNHKIDMLSYFITNGVWLDKSDPVLLGKFKAMRYLKPIVPETSLWWLRIMILIIIISGIPLIFGLFKGKISPNNHSPH